MTSHNQIKLFEFSKRNLPEILFKPEKKWNTSDLMNYDVT